MFYYNRIFRIFSKLNAVLLLKLEFYKICKPYNILNAKVKLNIILTKGV